MFVILKILPWINKFYLSIYLSIYLSRAYARMRVCVANFRSRDCPRGRENILLRTRRHFYIYEDLKCDLYHDVKDVITYGLPGTVVYLFFDLLLKL